MVRIYNGLLPSKVHRFRSQRKLIASRLLKSPSLREIVYRNLIWRTEVRVSNPKISPTVASTLHRSTFLATSDQSRMNETHER
jgi:hypothetical protein